jgi:hypothetical protein
MRMVHITTKSNSNLNDVIAILKFEIVVEVVNSKQTGGSGREAYGQRR